MKYPVDLLANVRPESLEQSGIEHMVKLTTEKTEDYLNLSESQEIKIGWNNVSLVPVYGDCRKLKVLALSIPGGPFEVGLFLQGQWWSAEDILKTANPLRTGLLKVSTPVERIVLYVLNKIIYRMKEMADDEEGFLYHGEDDFAKILWEGGKAIGFYSVKPKGSIFCKSLPDDFPVMDTIFVRRCHRRKGYGLNMLKDFVDNFRMEHLGLKGPLSSTIYQVCEKYLSTNPADSKLLWVVNKTGNYSTRAQIVKNQQTMKLKGNNCGQVECNLSFDAEDTEHLMETTEYTEVVEEVVWNKITKDVKDTAVETCDRSSTFGCNTTRKRTIETTENIKRMKDTESGVQSPGDEQLPEYHKYSLTVKETDSKNTDAVMHREAMPEMTYCSCNNQKVVMPEFEESLLDNLAPTTTQEVTVTPEEALEKEQVIKTNPNLNIQNIKNNGVAHTSTSSKTNISPVDCRPQELLQVLELGIVKVASEIKDVKNMMPQHDKAEDDEDMDGKETYEILETQIHKEQTDIAENTKKDQKVELAHKEKGYNLKEEKSNMMSKLVVEEDLDRDNNKASTGNGGCKRKFQYDSPVRHSKVLRNEPPESELTNRVLRSSIKEAHNQQMRSPQQTKSSKQPKKHEKGRCHKMDIEQETSKETSTERDREESQEENILQQLEPQLIDKTWNFSIEKSDKIPNEITETEEGTEKDDNRLSESNVTDKLVDVQMDKPVKERKTVGATGEIMDEKMYFEDDGASKSTEDSINDEQEEPVNQSNIVHDQPTKSKLIKKVLKISTKPDKATSKKIKAMKHQKKTKQAINEPECEQKKDIVESHSKAGQSDRDIVKESINVETEHLDQAAVNVHYITGVENKMKDGSLDISITDAKFRNDEQNNTATEDKLKATKHVAAESDEAQKKKPAIKGMPAENKTEESIVVLMLKKSIDKRECAKETLQSQEETDQDLQRLGGTDGTDGREESQKGLQQSQGQSESTENELVDKNSNLGKTVVKLGLEKPEEEILDEEFPFEMTKHLRYRTIVISPRQRKSKRLSKQVVTPHRKKPELNTNSKNLHENKEACEKTSQNIDTTDIAEEINVSGEDTGMKIMAQVEEKSEEDLMEEITKAESANKGNKLNKSHHERQQNEKMADEEAEASVTEANFTLELDEEVPEHVIVKESKTLHKECEKEATCEENIPDVTTKQVSPKQSSPRQSRSLIQESLSYTREQSVEEEVKKAVESEDKSECAKETLQSQKKTDQDLQGLGGTDGTDGREESQKGLQQSQGQSESTENELVEEVSENENVEMDEVMDQTGHCSSQESEGIINKKMEIEENVDAPESTDKDKDKIEKLQGEPEPVEKTKTVEDKARKPTDFNESSQGKKKLVIPNIQIELVDKNNSNLGKTVVKLGLEKPEEEILDEEFPFEMTKHLRYRTIVISPWQRKSKRLSKQVVTPHRKKPELNTNSKNLHENKEACEKTSQNIDTTDIAEEINVSGEDTGMKIMAQVEEKSEEDLMEEITKAESANKGDKLNKSHHERQQNEKMADEEAEASVTEANFTLELDEEVPEHVIVKESKTLHKECEKEATCEENIPDVTTKQVSPKQSSPRQSRSLIQESLSYTREQSVEEEVKKAVESEEENTPQQKRKAIKLTARRSKRFAKP